ncbi:amino acid aminotransferase [Roseimaritima ulvae]|uniref:Aspartate aminotransferase n=1 Tax=Roseimaritima ulvae TaxID=980254 RepID=A0A5B9QY63_9BACT|nr:amino acid aminotransferase [Roseimaritima ulvae]QEG38873.1 Aspartate aminotransferase [Roseimaritima ulvae]
MFETVSTAPPDAILGLSEAFQQDPNPHKINLSVGVYKDAEGKTPVLRCVKAAEQRIVDNEPTKSYLGIDGLPEYRQHVAGLLFGDTIDAERLAVVQTPGGTGGVRVAADFVGSQFAGAKVWISNPTWANHPAIFQSAGVATETYRYLNADRTGLDFEGLATDLTNGPAAGDAVLLHACCHNPTGVDPTAEQWDQVGAILQQRKLLPIIDFAYQGFGNGLQQDAAGLHTVLRHCPEALVCSSFSKNFGLYSERVGALTLVAAEADAATASLSQLKRLVRANYSNPPRHGAAIVATVLGDAELTSQWHDELAQMRQRIATMRQQFVERMRATGVDRDFQFLLNQNGMFSFSGLNPMQVDELRSQHSVYIVGSGRINVAGMTEDNLPRLCDAIAAVL